MKKAIGILLSLILVLICAFALADVEINETNFPDENFRQCVTEYDTDGDNILSNDELGQITRIDCSDKDISNLKGIEHFTVLRELYCGHNLLTSVDVSKNTALEHLDFYYNKLTSLDVSKNTALRYLYCSSNDIEVLNVSNNATLELIWCYGNELTSLDVSKCIALQQLGCHENALESLDVSNNTALTLLCCQHNPIKSLNISNNTKLQELICFNNQLTSLDVSKNTALSKLTCHTNQFTQLDVSSVPALNYLVRENDPKEQWGYKTWEKDVDGDGRTDHSLDVDPSVNVITGELKGAVIDSGNFPDQSFRQIVKSYDKDDNLILDEKEIASVTEVDCSNREISDLKGIEHFTALTHLYCADNQLTSLDVSANTALKMLSLHRNALTKLDVSKNTALEELICDYNQLSDLDVSANAALTHLSCTSNGLMSLNVSGNAVLKKLYCYANNLTRESISLNQILHSLVDNSDPIEAEDHLLWTADEDGDGEIEILFAADKSYIPEGVAINKRNFPDGNFRAYVSSFDKDGNGYLSDEEIAAVELIELDYSDISDLKGVEYFTALKRLYCENNQLKYLDISSNKALEVLYCAGNQLESLAVTENTKLTELYCASNKITALNLTMNTDLEILSCWDNQLTDLDVDRNTALRELICDRNGLTSLKVTKNTALLHLSCTGNQLKSLNLSNNKKLALLFCYDTRLTKLDVSKNPVLNDLVKKNKSVQADGHLEWKADADGDGEYESILAVGKDTKIVTDAIALSKVKVTAIKNQVCTGKAIKPTVVVQYKGKKLTKGTDYTVSYMDNKKVGMAKVTLTGIGDYTGTKKVTFKIVPKSVKLSSLTAGKKQLTVKWSKGTDITGYEIEYSLKKDFKTKKSIIIKKAATTKTVLKKLQAKTTYYVRIRAYKTVGGKKYYSAWSAVKNKKTK